MSPTLSIVVPCYNEADNLPALIARFAELALARSLDWELLLVDNGSTDDSAAVLARECAKPGRAFIRIVRVPAPNIGYGHGILTGLLAARGEFLGWTHADGQTPPADVLRAFARLRAGGAPRRTLVKGRRTGRPLKDVLFTLGMQAGAVCLLRENLADINAQPKVFHRDLLALALTPPVDLSLDLYFLWLAKQHGFALETIEVAFGARAHGDSKWAFSWRSKLRHISRTLRFMRALRRTPPVSSSRGPAGIGCRD